MGYYLIMSKPFDYGECNRIVIKAKLSDIKGKVYDYKKIPKEHYDILKIYLGEFHEYYELNELEDFFG